MISSFLSVATKNLHRTTYVLQFTVIALRASGHNLNKEHLPRSSITGGESDHNWLSLLPNIDVIAEIQILVIVMMVVITECCGGPDLRHS